MHELNGGFNKKIIQHHGSNSLKAFPGPCLLAKGQLKYIYIYIDIYVYIYIYICMYVDYLSVHHAECFEEISTLSNHRISP